MFIHLKERVDLENLGNIRTDAERINLVFIIWHKKFIIYGLMKLISFQ